MKKVLFFNSEKSSREKSSIYDFAKRKIKKSETLKNTYNYDKKTKKDKHIKFHSFHL